MQILSESIKLNSAVNSEPEYSTSMKYFPSGNISSSKAINDGIGFCKFVIWIGISLLPLPASSLM